jgi:hypothetical protein
VEVGEEKGGGQVEREEVGREESYVGRESVESGLGEGRGTNTRCC